MTLSVNISEHINELIAKEHYSLIVDFVTNHLQSHQTNHWLLGVLASAHYELRDYEKSKEILGEALNLKEDCPLLWWHLAGVLEAEGDTEDAITIWKQIISFDNSELCFLDDPCWESVEFKKGLIADSMFRIGNAYMSLGERTNALKYLKQFLDRKILSDDEELDSIYTVEKGMFLYKKLASPRWFRRSYS